ncbi:golgin subfamily A member 5 [Battus philenor]|uniref:golgin subfamily A member 5 n=1 Tax=Battus philenor TaxID=42288 RepID=UPI0035D06BEC
MSWFAELAGKAENLLNNIDEQTGAAIRSHNALKQKKHDYVIHTDNSWPQNRRTSPRSQKKPGHEAKRSPSPARKPYLSTTQSHTKEVENISQDQLKKKPPARKNATQNYTPITSRSSANEMKFGDWGIEQYGLRKRRNTLSGDINSLHRDNVYKLQNLEVENAMLKNEINVMNKEISELLDRLRKTEDDLSQYKSAPNNIELKLNNDMLLSQLEQLKRKLQDLITKDVKSREQSQELEAETSQLRSMNRQLDEKLKLVNEELHNKDLAISKLEIELRHAQVVISEQQSSIEKSTLECHRLEKDWESYKLRVKSMLFAKDEELKKLRDGNNLTEDTKELIDQIKALKEERDELSEQILKAKEESEGIKVSMTEMGTRHAAVERIVIALRDALKEERSARNRAEMQCVTLGKELKTTHHEMGQTIVKLRNALQAKAEELNMIQENSSAPTTDTSALNVADYDVAQVAMDNERIQHLSQMLVQKQSKVESLLADNNTLRIQLDKLQSKYKTEMAALRANHLHSVVQVQDGEMRSRTRGNNYSPNALAKLSLRIGVLSRRYPVFRVFLIVYMVGLHLWVFTVLLTTAPEDYSRPRK